MHVPHKKIIKLAVAVTDYSGATQWIIDAAQGREGRYVCVANVHMCMETHDHGDFEQIVNSAGLTVPDGMPLVWALKLLGEKQAGQVRGSDLFLKLCAEAEKRSIPVGLYGGTPASLRDLNRFLGREFPSLSVVCGISPPFRPLTPREDGEYIQQINAAGARILFVGIGCPNQEKWMAGHKEKLTCVMVGVGAAFDFFSGRKKHAPRWMQKAGLEWIFRLASDPKRLWKRYLKHNPRFIWYFAKQLLRSRFKSTAAGDSP